MAFTRVLYCILFVASIYLSPNGVICRNIFTAYNHMAKLASVELELHQALQDYINAEETKLLQLREFSKLVARARQLGTDATKTALKDHAANPISAYLMLKRFVWQWQELNAKLEGNQGML